MPNFISDDILILLGAGASCNAGILNSSQMINSIEEDLDKDDWRKFKPLYQYIKSIHFQKEILHGNRPENVVFNIENLVSLLDTIIKIAKPDAEPFVFVGSWEKRLNPFISGEQTESLASSFRENIIKRIRGAWLMPDDWKSKSAYYKSLIEFKNELDGMPLEIFTLNYDLCVEHNLSGEHIEDGFDENGNWSFRRYDHEQENQIGYYLYKLHGSINWKKSETERLIKTEGHIDTNDLAIIFGVDNKLQSLDPYLFYFYLFREHCLNAKLIIASGYGFMDEHINDVIRQAFKDSPKKKLAINMRCPDVGATKTGISARLKISEDQIEIFNKDAVSFFRDDLKRRTFEGMFNTVDDSLPPNF